MSASKFCVQAKEAGRVILVAGGEARGGTADWKAVRLSRKVEE